MDVCNYRLSAASAAITAGHQLKKQKQAADGLNYSRFLALQRVEVRLQRLQKTFWGLWKSNQKGQHTL